MKRRTSLIGIFDLTNYGFVRLINIFPSVANNPLPNLPIGLCSSLILFAKIPIECHPVLSYESGNTIHHSDWQCQRSFDTQRISYHQSIVFNKQNLNLLQIGRKVKKQ